MVVQDWFTGLRDVSRNLAAYVPALLGAALFVVSGWLLGRLLRYLSARLVASGLDRLGRSPSLQSAISTTGARATVPRVIGGFVFWAVFLFFVAAALEALGLPVITESLNRLAYYLPNVLAALVVLFAGIILGTLAKGTVAKAAASAGVAFGATVAGAVQGTVLLVAIVVALEQLGIKAELLVVIVGVVTGTTLAGAGLAFGLGARTAVSNIIASYYVAQAYRVGQTIRIGGVEGKILQTTPTAVFLGTPQGRVLIPAKQFGEEASVLVSDG